MDMTDDMVAMLARRAGLDLALAEFPEDVAAAANTAATAAAAIVTPADIRAEPWPPMQTAPRP